MKFADNLLKGFAMAGHSRDRARDRFVAEAMSPCARLCFVARTSERARGPEDACVGDEMHVARSWAASLVFASLLSVHFFGFVLAPNFVLGAAVVVLATFLYLIDGACLENMGGMGDRPGPGVCEDLASRPGSDRPAGR